jgi:hypothetical protein
VHLHRTATNACVEHTASSVAGVLEKIISTKRLRILPLPCSLHQHCPTILVSRHYHLPIQRSILYCNRNPLQVNFHYHSNMSTPKLRPNCSHVLRNMPFRFLPSSLNNRPHCNAQMQTTASYKQRYGTMRPSQRISFGHLHGLKMKGILFHTTSYCHLGPGTLKLLNPSSVIWHSSLKTTTPLVPPDYRSMML